MDGSPGQMGIVNIPWPARLWMGALARWELYANVTVLLRAHGVNRPATDTDYDQSFQFSASFVFSLLHVF